MSRPRRSIEPATTIGPQQEAFEETPEIWWPSIGYGAAVSRDRGCFPSLDDVESKVRFWENGDEAMRQTLASLAFIDSAIRSSRRIWILDPHFGRTGYLLLKKVVACNQISRIRIVSRYSKDEDVPRWTIQLVSTRNENKLLQSASNPGRIEWRTTRRRSKSQGEPRLHDRYAVVDGELWHFGSTVGGAHPSLTTFSRGWDADVRGAVTFFADLWNTLDGPLGRRR
ncbi:hypothetical protein ACFL51_00315 [Myxococcota bacterium]